MRGFDSLIPCQFQVIMKTKLKFINGLQSSPTLEVEHDRLLSSFIGQFLESLSQTDPNKIMIEFIAAALKAKGSLVKPLSVSKDALADIDVSVRKANIVEFVYHKDDGSSSWRKIDLLEEDGHYIKGNDVEDSLKFKCFKRALIVGGRIIRQDKK
jgi:hypothetical protein